jgi:hypothetical protein
VAYDSTERTGPDVLAEFQAVVNRLINEKAINPWCGICHSDRWHYEDGRTPFQTMDEAQAELLRLQDENLRTRTLIDERRAARN